MSINPLQNSLVSEKNIPLDYYLRLPNKETWISYWYQLYEVLNTKPRTVLEIGPGNNIVSNVLRKLGIEVITVDINRNLQPDILCSVTNLSECINRQFDTILCAEVLEHLPFEYFEKSIEEIWKVTKQYVMLSLSEGNSSLRINMKASFTRQINLVLDIPFLKRSLGRGHYWEIGRDDYSLQKISSIISQYFSIEKTYRVPENPYHRFFVLKNNS